MGSWDVDQVITIYYLKKISLIQTKTWKYTNDWLLRIFFLLISTVIDWWLCNVFT